MVPLNRNTTNHLKSLDSDLEAVHGGDGCLRAARVVEADEPEALALVGGAVNKHLQQWQCVIESYWLLQLQTKAYMKVCNHGEGP